MAHQDPSVSTHQLTAYYVTGLMLIGCLSVCFHIVERSSLQNSRGFAAVVNRSGRQRMLSQRIAALATEYRYGDATARLELEKMIPRMQGAHDTLATPYRADAAPGTYDHQLHAIYFEQPLALDDQTRQFLATARQVTLLSPGDPGLPPLILTLNTAARAPLLDALDQVVTVHQQEADARLTRLAQLDRILLGIMILTLCLEAQLIFRPMVDKVGSYSRRLIALTNTDQLTGADNRRGFDLHSRAEFDRLQRHGQRLSVLALDVDFFKKINDTYGHPAGDSVLHALGQALRQSLRPSDVLARLGGEEFTILLPQTGLAEAVILAERLCATISVLGIQHEQHTLAITVSIGAAEVPFDARDINSALENADQMLYQAKHSGRNRVTSRQQQVTDLIEA